jgi:hypothetical protein
VTIQTVASENPTVAGATASGSYTSGSGDIYVNDAVSWSSGKTLTLNAYNNIYINKAIDASGGSGGKLALLGGQGTTDGGDSSYAVNAKVSLQAGANYSTKFGTNSTTRNYTVITLLGGAGDEANSTTNSLQGISKVSKLGGYYALGADIDASSTSDWNGGSGFVPIGLEPIPNNQYLFNGRFDGLGHTITGLTINRSATDRVGLFGGTGLSAQIRNVGLLGGSFSGRSNVGGLVGYNAGKIRGSYVTGDVTASADTVGGLVGYNSGSITNGGIGPGNYATGKVSGPTRVGGLVGWNAGNIDSAYATGSATGADGGYALGGLAGYNEGGLSNSYATGNVSGNGAYNVGGLVDPTLD